MATLDDLSTALIRADAAGDTAGAQALAAHIKWLKDPAGGNYQPPHNPAADMPSMNPIDGMSTFQQGLAGAGQAVHHTAMGIGQALGLVSRQDVADARKLDAPLDATTAGKVGNFVGNAGIMAIPSILAPPLAGGFLAQTAGNAAVGAGLGALQPSTSTGETVKNAGLGMVAGGVAPAIGRGVQAVGNYGASFVAPLFKSGQEGIAGRALNTFAGSPQAAQDAVTAMQSATPAVAGVQPTIGMVSGNGGLANFQRAIANNPDVVHAFTARGQGNTNALLDALGGIAGNDTAMASAQAARSAAADPLYAAAKTQTVPVDGSLNDLLKRPLMQKAMARAEELAKNKGETISTAATPSQASSILDAAGNPASTTPGTPGQVSVNGLHYLKLALDDMAENPSMNGIGKNELSAIVTSKNALLDALDSKVPDYAAARQAFAQGSQPINRMQVGKALLDKLSPALNDYSANKVLRPGPFAEALASGDTAAQKATGFAGAKMDQILTPQDMQTVQGVGQTLGQVRDSQTLGKAIGSNTVQNQISQDALRQIAGPLGLPQGFTENALMQRLMFPQQVMGKFAEPKVTGLLGQAALDPKMAAGLMLRQLQKTDDPRLRNALARAILLGGRTEAATLSQ